MPFEIPTSNKGYTSFTIGLDEFVFGFNTYYNSVVKMWYCDITIDGNLIVSGAALTPNTNLLSFRQSLTEEFGQLRIIDLNGNGNTTPESLGSTSQLIYYAPGEFEATYPEYDSPQPLPLTYDFDALFEVVP